MKTKTIIYSLFTLLLLMGCKDEPQYTRFENHTISACGITDPLYNLPWLKTYCSEHYNTYSTSISIYKNILTDENSIIIVHISKSVPDQSPSRTFTEEVYTCEGVRILFQSSDYRPDGWDNFLVQNTLVAKIWSVEEITKN
jgi:hypothetical protein